MCHCKYCQKDAGSAHAANIVITTVKLSWIKGSEKVKTYNLAPTRHTKSFCQTCGSALPYEINGKRLIVPAGSLDSEITMSPNAHIFVSSQASWAQDLEGIQKFEKFPTLR